MSSAKIYLYSILMVLCLIGLKEFSKKSHVREPQTEPVVVAVVDTGIDSSHAMFKDKVLTGYDFVEQDEVPQESNSGSHGTMMSGIILSVANSDKVKLLPLKYSSEKTSALIANTAYLNAINFAINSDARIINISSSGTDYLYQECELLAEAAKRGKLVVVAAGNESTEITKSKPVYPVMCNFSNVIAVASDAISSNYSTTYVHITAPGKNILAPIKGGGYAIASGSSQATAFVSGVAAAILSKEPNLSYFELKEKVLALGIKSELYGYKSITGKMLPVNAVTSYETSKQ